MLYLAFPALRYVCFLPPLPIIRPSYPFRNLIMEEMEHVSAGHGYSKTPLIIDHLTCKITYRVFRPKTLQTVKTLSEAHTLSCPSDLLSSRLKGGL